jgi:microcystin-dependent protein
MAYTISYTDSVNKGTIVVEDNTLNQETSLSYPGKNYTGYGTAVNENFLHLLENFASSSSPTRPVEGQLWYDTSTGVDQLKIYDGTTWIAASGVKKATNQPAVANSSSGDLWVNTETQQLYLFTGAAWILVGPDFSDGLLTGAQAESIIGSDDVTYSVLSIKIKNQTGIIISSQAFTPKTTITGFQGGINAGMNLSASALVGTSVLKYYGVSEKAENLVVNNTIVPATNFLRSDAESSSNFQLNIKNDQGIVVGTSGQLGIQIENQSTVFRQNSDTSNIDFRMLNSTSYDTILRLDARGFIGVNNTAPESALDIKGSVKVNQALGDPTSGKILIDTTYNSTDLLSGTFVTKGGIAVAKDIQAGGNIILGGNDDNNEATAGYISSGNISPTTTGRWDIGSAVLKYDNVYANTYFGNLQGNVSGTVSGRAGSADRIASATTFGITGDVTDNSFEYDGQVGGTTKTFNVRIANSFISNKTTLPFSDNEDEILLNKFSSSGGFDSGVYKVKKSTFLSTIPLVPAGGLMPFAGSVLPSGWLFCDGSIVNISDYSILFTAIGYAFKDRSLLLQNGATTFGLPDFRGRFALGLDNMNGAPAGRVTNAAAGAVGGNAGTEAVRVRDVNLPEHDHNLEGPSGNQYYALREAAGEPSDNNAIKLTVEPGLGGTQGLASSGGIAGGGATGSGDFTNIGTEEVPELVGAPLDTMNPYLAVNYIIYTGN